MILRLLNLVVIGALVLAAAYVYRIKYDATLQAERLAKLRGEVRKESDRIATMARVRDVFDPQRALNPEKIFPSGTRCPELTPPAQGGPT